MKQCNLRTKSTIPKSIQTSKKTNVIQDMSNERQTSRSTSFQLDHPGTSVSNLFPSYTFKAALLINLPLWLPADMSRSIWRRRRPVANVHSPRPGHPNGQGLIAVPPTRPVRDAAVVSPDLHKAEALLKYPITHTGGCTICRVCCTSSALNSKRNVCKKNFKVVPGIKYNLIK